MNPETHQHTATPKLFDTPSGLGGSFTVRVLEELEEGKVHVQIWMPGNPDFHRNTFVTTRDALKPTRRHNR
ncbi:hypothetical protein [Marinobacter sp. tcs-11]|uniref:hypothetical protein n=1 Tax=Marinobacter sp. tcs-11 TaxID=1742860 RepID=UPI0005A2FC29|nr:hypothetical protein [Marinobacter sp. tcs-11]|tara:strand:- start:782 stop:994 length:213 start_codon:yes stop_codon:yes gene_type:complete